MILIESHIITHKAIMVSFLGRMINPAHRPRSRDEDNGLKSSVEVLLK